MVLHLQQLQGLHPFAAAEFMSLVSRKKALHTSVTAIAHHLT
jgi:hypothetical protein